MKTIVKILVLIATIFVGYGCDNGPTGEGVLGMESVYGFVCNEDGERLAGIRVDVYYDKELTQHYPAGDWKEWENMSEEDKRDCPECEPITYTLEDGYYGIAQLAHNIKNPLDLYVVATDTAGIYETKLQSGQMRYKWGGGWMNMDFILKKK